MTDSNTEERLTVVEKDVLIINKDMEMVNKINDKFEASLSKISDATQSVSQLLAVHDNAIHAFSKVHDDLYREIEQNKTASADDRKALMEEIEKSNKTTQEVLVAKIDKLDDDISEKIGEIADNLSDHDKRIRGLERITFIGLGLAMLVGIIVDKIPFDKIF